MAKQSLVQNDPKAKAAAVKELKSQIKTINDNIKGHSTVLTTAAKAHTDTVKGLLSTLGKANVEAGKLIGKDLTTAVTAANKAYADGIKAANTVYTEATAESVKGKVAAVKLLEKANAALAELEAA